MPHIARSMTNSLLVLLVLLCVCQSSLAEESPAHVQLLIARQAVAGQQPDAAIHQPGIGDTQTFDAQGRDTGTIDAANNATQISYGTSSLPNLPTSTIDRDGKTVTTSYDAFGNVLSVTDPSGSTVHL